MKRFIFLLVAILSFILAIAPNFADDCPEGYSGPYTLQGTFYYDYAGGHFSCNVYIIYCCYFDYQSSPKKVINEIEETYESTGYHCMANIPVEFQDEFERWKHEYVSKNSACNPPFPPCDEDTAYISKTREASCMYYKNYEKFTRGEFILTLKGKECVSDAYCESSWAVCIDYSGPEPEVRWIYQGTTVYGAPGCPNQEPTLPPNGKTWDEYWITNCFLYSCY